MGFGVSQLLTEKQNFERMNTQEKPKRICGKRLSIF